MPACTQNRATRSRHHRAMAMAPHVAEVHRLVDRLQAGQIEALYVLLRGMLPDRAGSAQPPADAGPLEDWRPSPDAPAVRRLSISGIARGDHDLVQELAELTGETQTMAVTIAVRERLERVRHLREAGLADRLLAIGRDTAPRLREPFRTADHGDLLYDERGLPA